MTLSRTLEKGRLSRPWTKVRCGLMCFGTVCGQLMVVFLKLSTTGKSPASAGIFSQIVIVPSTHIVSI